MSWNKRALYIQFVRETFSFAENNTYKNISFLGKQIFTNDFGPSNMKYIAFTRPMYQIIELMREMKQNFEKK